MSKIIFTGERMIPELNKGYTFYYEHLNRYLFSLQFVKNKSVLDLGCGVGYGSFILSEKAKSVVGVDKSKIAIDYAIKNYKKNTQFIASDVFSFPLKKGEFDTVVCFEFIEHISNQDKVLKLVKKVLKKDGVFIVSTPNKINYLVENRFHKKELTKGEFLKLLKKYFVNVVLLNQYFWFSNNIVNISENNGSEFDVNFRDMNSIIPNTSEASSQYLIAICSDKKIENFEEHSLQTEKVDGIDISLGVESLKIPTIDGMLKVNELQKEIVQIKQSKIYKVWNAYHRLLSFIKTNE